jgi:hypothetical protein
MKIIPLSFLWRVHNSCINSDFCFWSSFNWPLSCSIDFISRKKIQHHPKSYLGINLIKEMKDLHIEIIKHWWNKLKKEQLNRKISHVREPEILKCPYYPKQCTVQCITHQYFNGILYRNRKQKYLKYVCI